MYSEFGPAVRTHTHTRARTKKVIATSYVFFFGRFEDVTSAVQQLCHLLIFRQMEAVNDKSSRAHFVFFIWQKTND